MKYLYFQLHSLQRFWQVSVQHYTFIAKVLVRDYRNDRIDKKNMKALFLLLFVTKTVIALQPTEDDFTRWENAWDSLIPAGTYDFISNDMNFNIMFDPTFQAKLDAAGKVIDASLEGQTTELAGFMVALELNNRMVSSFLLVPEAGQCIHVPPPPMNQTIFIDTTHFPTKLRDLYQPVIVRGRLSVVSNSFNLKRNALAKSAETGYTLIAEHIAVSYTHLTLPTIE